MPQTIPQASSPTISQEAPEAVSLGPQWRALQTSAAFAPLPDLGWIEVTGPDRVRWLNGMVTNSVGSLAPGEGCYNFILSAQGRIQGDANIFAEPGRLLLQTALAEVPNLLTLLDRFIIMDDVELADISSIRKGLLIAGPQASEILAGVGLLPPAADTLALAHLFWQSHDLSVVRAWSPLVPRFEIWADNSSAIEQTSADLLNRGLPKASPAALHLLRIAEGTPLFGVDIRDRDLPQETGAARALHFSKGCYLGQEIVERIRSRGNVHRTFGGFLLEGTLPPPGTALTLEGKPVGELTGAAVVPSGNPVQLGLGYIRREALALGKPIQYDGGTARPIPLPFREATIL